jgi:maleate isomerase
VFVIAGLRLGAITPSSNTVLEPMCAAILRDLPQVSMHFARVRVTEISLERRALDQFLPEAFEAPAGLLADARVDTLGWNGTSASWTGFTDDERLCQGLEARFAVPATSAVLALNELVALSGARRLGLVTPYTADVQARILSTYRSAGYESAAECHLGITDNFSFGLVEEDEVLAMLEAVARQGPDAILVMCTNLRAAHLAARIEAQYGVTVLDSVSAYVWKSLLLVGVDPDRIRGWGRLFGLGGGIPRGPAPAGAAA